MTCSCTTSFGRLVWAPDCGAHKRCPVIMRGVPIQCILTADHEGDHQ